MGDPSGPPKQVGIRKGKRFFIRLDLLHILTRIIKKRKPSSKPTAASISSEAPKSGQENRRNAQADSHGPPRNQQNVQPNSHDAQDNEQNAQPTSYDVQESAKDDPTINNLTHVPTATSSTSTSPQVCHPKRKIEAFQREQLRLKALRQKKIKKYLKKKQKKKAKRAVKANLKQQQRLLAKQKKQHRPSVPKLDHLLSLTDHIPLTTREHHCHSGLKKFAHNGQNPPSPFFADDADVFESLFLDYIIIQTSPVPHSIKKRISNGVFNDINLRIRARPMPSPHKPSVSIAPLPRGHRLDELLFEATVTGQGFPIMSNNCVPTALVGCLSLPDSEPTRLNYFSLLFWWHTKAFGRAFNYLIRNQFDEREGASRALAWFVLLFLRNPSTSPQRYISQRQLHAAATDKGFSIGLLLVVIRMATSTHLFPHLIDPQAELPQDQPHILLKVGDNHVDRLQLENGPNLAIFQVKINNAGLTPLPLSHPLLTRYLGSDDEQQPHFNDYSTPPKITQAAVDKHNRLLELRDFGLLCLNLKKFKLPESSHTLLLNMTHIKSLTNPNRKGIIPLSQVHPNHAMLVSEHFLSLIETSSDNPTAHQLADVLITQLLIPLPTHAEWPPKSTDPDNEPDPPNPFQDLVTNLIDAQLLAIRTHQVQYSTVTLDQAAAICHKHISQANGCLGNIPPGSAPYATLSRHSSNIELALGSLESHLPPNPHHSLPINYNLPNRPLRQRDRAAQDNNPLVQLDDHFDLEAVIAEHNNEHMVDDNNNNYLGGDNNDNDGQEDHQDDIPPQPSGFQAQIQPAGRPNHPIPDANVQPLEDLPPTNVIIHQGNDVQIERINAEAPMAQPIPLADNLPLDELSAHFAALGNAIMNADDATRGRTATTR